MAAPPGDYKYDVFFSYKRHGLTLDWTNKDSQAGEILVVGGTRP
jgi:hypothetical protein